MPCFVRVEVQNEMRCLLAELISTAQEDWLFHQIHTAYMPT